MSGFKKIKGLIGTIGNKFQFGYKQVMAKAQGGTAIDFRDKDDLAYANVRVASPIGDNDATPKLYVDTQSKPLIVKRQADTSTAIPNNTATRGFVVVTTAGSGAVIGDVLFDDGSASGQMTILNGGPGEGRTIAVTDPLTGGTISFDADSIYIWDADGISWIKIGDIGSVTGATRVISVPFTFNDQGSFVDSTSLVPAGAVVLSSTVDFSVAFDGTAPTVSIGNSGNTSLVQGVSDNDPTEVGNHQNDEVIAWTGGALPVRVSVGGSLATAGSGVAYVVYATPNS